MKKLILIRTFLIFWLSFTLVTTVTASIIDQFNPSSHTTGLNTSSGGGQLQQEVVAGIDGILTGINLFVTTTEFGGTQNNFNFGINVGSGWQTDSNDFSTFIATTLDGFLFIDVSSANIILNTGDSFMIDITPFSSSTIFGVGATSDNSYSSGALFSTGSVFSDGKYDLSFESHMEVNAVPEPTSLALLGLGLAGFIFSIKKKKT